MYLDYSKLEFDQYGRPEAPVLMLKTLSGDTIGVLSGVYDLKLNIKFAEPSEISFELPAVIDGVENPLYEAVTGRKIIYTKHYGVYVTMNPSVSDDGISRVKSVKGYSVEKRLDDKRFFLEEGTFNFWNPASPTDTILGRVMEIAPDWAVGYISPALVGRYRTFDSYDDYLLSFCYNSAAEKFRCVFVFDPYAKTINVYDADEERATLPIYLDFDNLLQSVDVEELSEELVTALRPYGADELDIRDVNPIGSNWLYDLSYFIDNGDIPLALAERWNAWQALVAGQQEYYKGLVCMRASGTARQLKARAELTDLNGELTDLTNQQSVTIQALASESTTQGKTTQQQLLDEINRKIATKKAEISEKEAEVSAIEDDLAAYQNQVEAVVAELAIEKFFSDEEYSALRHYFVEQDITEDTFIATDVNTTVSGQSYELTDSLVSVSGSAISKIDLTEKFQKDMYVMAGGALTLTGDVDISCDIIRSTLERAVDGGFILSIYAGTICVGEKSAPSGMITVTGSAHGLVSDVGAVDDGGVVTYEGSSLSFQCDASSLYLTANVSEYQKYSVKMELYDYAKDLLAELATPTYEFTVDSGNFLFAKEFSPFRNKLQLGSGVYLNVRDTGKITPLIIEFSLDFENLASFSLVFSNRFKRHDSVNTLKDMLEKSYSSGRSFDASKYIYNKSAGQMSSVSEFMNNSLIAARNAVVAAENQSVVIDGAGIHVGGDAKDQLRITNSMLAMSDDDWATAKMAIGRFSSPEVGDYFGINAEVLGGNLIVGKNLIIENEQVDEGGNPTGIMQFKVDATGAWLYNSTFVLQSDTVQDEQGNVTGAGGIIIDPRWGIVAGTGDLFTTNGTTVTPSFVDDSGALELDDDGIPVNTNFYLNISDGNAYFRGTVNAVSGKIGGWSLAEDYLYSGKASDGTYVALNASDSTNALYAIWAGGDTPGANGNANFYVTRKGELYAKSGTFKGTVEAASYKDKNGNSMMTDDYKFSGGYLDLKGINVGDGNFVVDSGGNVTVRGIIEAGTMYGDDINLVGRLNVGVEHNGVFTGYGYIGTGYGADAEDNQTYGAKLTSADGNNYIIVTDGGVRIQAGNNRITTTGNSINLTTADGDDNKVLVNGHAIGGGQAVFG